MPERLTPPWRVGVPGGAIIWFSFLSLWGSLQRPPQPGSTLLDSGALLLRTPSLNPRQRPELGALALPAAALVLGWGLGQPLSNAGVTPVGEVPATVCMPESRAHSSTGGRLKQQIKCQKDSTLVSACPECAGREGGLAGHRSLSPVLVPLQARSLRRLCPPWQVQRNISRGEMSAEGRKPLFLPQFGSGRNTTCVPGTVTDEKPAVQSRHHYVLTGGPSVGNWPCWWGQCSWTWTSISEASWQHQS